VVFDGQTISLGCWASRVRLGVGAGGVDAAAYPLRRGGLLDELARPAASVRVPLLELGHALHDYGLPNEIVIGVTHFKPGAGHKSLDFIDGVNEGSERHLSQGHVAVAQHQTSLDPPLLTREDQRQVPAGLDDRCTQEPLHPWVATDDAVHDNDVGRFDLVLYFHEVSCLPFDPIGDTFLVGQKLRSLFISGGQLHVDTPGGAGLEQLHLNGTDTATNLQDFCFLDTFGLQVPENRRSHGIEASPSVDAQVSVGFLAVEEAAIRNRVTAVRQEPDPISAA